MSSPERSRSSRLWALGAALFAAGLLVPTGVNAAVDAFRLQDADSSNKAQVDGGKLSVGDGRGKLTVDGDVGSTDSRLLDAGDCDETDNGELENESSLPEGTTVTSIVLTNDAAGAGRNTLFVRQASVPGFDLNQPASGRFMALQTGYTQGYADFNEQVEWSDGIRLTEAWHFYCTGVLGSAQGDALWSVYGDTNS
ncbi:MAG: hypothetical protein M3174_05110 [Actinomycetota bacterium]|nr:hypothetical protein [Actinomycetota bacterium]